MITSEILPLVDRTPTASNAQALKDSFSKILEPKKRKY